MRMPLLIAPLLTLLAACAPATEGSTQRSPLPWESGQQFELVQGTEVYLGLEYPLAEFGLTPAKLSGSFWIPTGVNDESADASQRFSLRDVRVPAGWRLELADVRVERTVKTRYGRETGETSYAVKPVLLVAAPQDARLGVTILRGELVARGGESTAIEMPLRVRAPAR